MITKYQFSLSQTGDQAPTETPFISPSGIDWSRDAAGVFYGIKPDGFKGKLSFSVTQGEVLGDGYSIGLTHIDDNTIRVNQYGNDGLGKDFISNASFVIEVNSTLTP